MLGKVWDSEDGDPGSMRNVDPRTLSPTNQGPCDDANAAANQLQDKQPSCFPSGQVIDLIKGDACKWEVGKGFWLIKRGGAVIIQLMSGPTHVRGVDFIKVQIKRADPAMSNEPVVNCDRHRSTVKGTEVSCSARHEF